MIHFAHIEVLLALALLPPLAWLARRAARARRATVRFSDVRHLRTARPSLALRMRGMLLYLRLAVLALLIVAMARPQYGIADRRISSEGIDIFLVLDCSGSMQAQDFKPNRLEAAKRVLNDFVKGRTNDRIGVIVFATTSFVLVPLTLDYAVITEFVDRVDFGYVDPNRTAIGSALANAVKKLEDSKARSRVIVLLTDGQSNAGAITPELAAETARALGIRVYTIGVGSKGPALMPGPGGFFGGFTLTPEADIDEPTLQAIAAKTNGQYFRATDNRSLEKIFKDIDQLETTKIEETQYVNYNEQMAWLVWPALGLLLLEILLGYTRFLKLP